MNVTPYPSKEYIFKTVGGYRSIVPMWYGIYQSIQLKTQYERDLQAKEESGEEKRRGMAKAIRDLETELDEERKQKTAAVNAKKKLDADYKDLESNLEMNSKMKRT